MVRTALLFVVCIAVAACQPQKFNGVDITGSSIGPDFSLADHTGTTRKLADFRGKVVVLFFGFMNCPDVCPTTLSDMAAVKQKLGRDGDRVQVIFVTLDPERDSAALLAQYVPAFDPTFLGLRGSVDFWDDFGVSLLKSAVFGGTAALVAAYVGFHAEPTIEGTSVATTRAVVNASLLVLMFNFILSALLFL